MRLSVCLIARDEAARLPLALESVRAIADEIILVDTGSTDQTADIARDFGARVYHHPWDDDFAAARNAALPHVRGRWMLWIDADERVLPESSGELDEMLARTDALAYGVLRHDYVGGIKPGQPRGPYVASQILRLVRMDLGFRFTGRCHEQLDPWPDEMAARTGLRLYASHLTLDHDCDYFFEGRARKSRRNGRLLEMEVRDRPGRAYFMIQCAASLLDLPESAERGHSMMREALQQVAAMRSRDRAPYGIVILALEYAAANWPQTRGNPLPLSADEAIDLADRWFPNAAPVVWLRARREYDRGNFEGAIPLLRRLLRMGETRGYDLEIPFDPAIVGDDARLNLGVCLMRLGMLDEAEAMFRAIGPNSPRAPQATANLISIASLRRQFAE